ncbi:class I lanthipeptide [Myxococcus sp. SDU36]|uniref:class I lanthipeptide n=1 Tax=Myxococcus sp. SDU36 TaxID=2831967 RepID=UPI0025434F91|nr:class I lanthipeptide [Myxococcus sp. SDU36]WIG95367.1 class I lanthipeptide [Myxococcus sp. SDU36]
MSAQAAKKLSLKKETLRPLDSAQVEQLDGAVGGTTPTITTVTVTVVFVPSDAH